MSFTTVPIYENGKAIGISIPPVFAYYPDCSLLFDPADTTIVVNVLFRIGEVMIVRELGSIDFFSSANEGWNVSLIFIAVLVYLVTRPYNKRVALRSVASGTQLQEFDQVAVLLDMSNLLLYLRSKESVMGTDRFFYKKQLKV